MYRRLPVQKSFGSLVQRRWLLSGLLLSGLLLFLIPAEKAYAAEAVMGPLIQTTTPREEYLGLVHLGLLQTEENLKGAAEQAIGNVMPSIVRIQTGQFTGSGMILEISEDTLFIVSNKHQLFSQEFSGVQLYNGETVSGRRVYLSKDYDLGFLAADISGMSYEKRGQLRCIRAEADCEEALVRGTEIFLVGSADGVACNIYRGEIADPWYYFDEFGSYMIYNYCTAKAGMSGGGTYDTHGHCIGMVTGGHDDETASLPMSLIRKEWEKFTDHSSSSN